MHPIIKSILGIKEHPLKIEAEGGPKAHENYKRFKACCDLLNLKFEEFNKGYQVRCTGTHKSELGVRFDYYPTTGKGSWTGSNEYFEVDSIENFLFINFKN